MPRDQHKWHRIDPRPQHRSTLLPPHRPPDRYTVRITAVSAASPHGCPAPNALGGTSSMTAPSPQRQRHEPGPGRGTGRFVDQCPALTLCRHTSTRCPSPSARAASSLAASSGHTPGLECSSRARRIDDDAQDEGLTDAVCSTTHMRPMRCSRTRRTTCPCRARWEGSPTRAAPPMAQTTRGQTALDPICETPGCRLLATEVDHVVPLSPAATAGTGPTCSRSATTITPPRTSSTASAAGPDRDEGDRWVGIATRPSSRQRRGGRVQNPT